MAGATKISFTIRKPVPIPQPASSGSSDNEDDHITDELVTGFDQFGVQRLHEKPKQEPQRPLVIPALQNRDWRELARKRSQMKRVKLETDVKVETDMDLGCMEPNNEDVKAEDNATEDQRAIRALMASANNVLDDGEKYDILPIPITETDAYRQDVQELPNQATLDDYARVPVAQFGAALLRGMGWTEGTAASRTRKGLVEPYLPESRPSLLGIGAKEREIVDDGSKQRKGVKRPERRYVPVIKKEREGSGTESGRDRDRERSGSAAASRRRSLSPKRPDSRRPSPPTSRRSSRSPPHRVRERDYPGPDYRSRKDGGRDFEDRIRDGQIDTCKSYSVTSDWHDRVRKSRSNRSSGTNGDSNGRRMRD